MKKALLILGAAAVTAFAVLFRRSKRHAHTVEEEMKEPLAA